MGAQAARPLEVRGKALTIPRQYTPICHGIHICEAEGSGSRVPQQNQARRSPGGEDTGLQLPAAFPAKH